MVRWLWSTLLRFVARHRAVVLAILSAVASTFMASAVTTPSSQGWPWQMIVFGAAVLLIVLAGAVPAEYEVTNRLDFMLPVIFRVLDLQPGDRIAVHRLLRFPTKGYEQLTEYYPRPRKSSVGRRFPMSHGIVARALVNRHPRAWAVPDGMDFREAMVREWSFTDDEVARLTQDRRSFIAYPIGQQGEYAHAVLYLDSADRSRFGGAAGDAALVQIGDYFDAQLQNAFAS